MLKRPPKPARRQQLADQPLPSSDLRLHMLNSNSILPDATTQNQDRDEESGEESSSSSSLLPTFMRSPKLFCSPARSDNATARSTELPATRRRQQDPTPQAVAGRFRQSTVRPGNSAAPNFTERFGPTSLVMYPVPESEQYKGGRGLNMRPLPSGKSVPGSSKRPKVSKSIADPSSEAEEDPFDHDYEETSGSRKRKPTDSTKQKHGTAFKDSAGFSTSATRKSANTSTVGAGKTSKHGGRNKKSEPVEWTRSRRKTDERSSLDSSTVFKPLAGAAGGTRKTPGERKREKLVMKLDTINIKQRLIDLKGGNLSAAEQKEREKLLLKLEEFDVRLQLFDIDEQEEGTTP